MKEPIAATIGFLVVPLIPALAIMMLSSPIEWKPFILPDISVVSQAILIGYDITLLFIYPFIIPIYYFAKRYNFIFLWSTSLLGCLTGAIFTEFFFAQCWSHLNCIKINLLGILMPVIVGGIGGAIFWAIWETLRDKIKHAPNK